MYTVNRLLTTICPEGITGDCIAIENAQVLDAAISGDRFSFYLKAKAEGLMCITIPKILVTDYSGNQLQDSIYHQVIIGPSHLDTPKYSIVAFSSTAMCPMIALFFETPMKFSKKAEDGLSSIRVTHGTSTSPVDVSDVRIHSNIILIPFDTSYYSSEPYLISIPPGFFKDVYGNYFRGFIDNELKVTSLYLLPIASQVIQNRSSYLIAAIYIVVGVVISTFG